MVDAINAILGAREFAMWPQSLLGVSLIGVALHLIAYTLILLIDTSIFLLAIRLVCRRHRVNLLASFDAAGRPIVQELNHLVAVVCLRAGMQHPLSELQRIWLALAVLVLGRLIVSALV